MNPQNILFIGMYPNRVNEYRNVFFRNLIYAIADLGVKCTVLSPVSVTKYKTDVFKIKYHTVDRTDNGSEIDVYYPKYISASAIQIGKWNTMKLTERLFKRAVFRAMKHINTMFDCVYGHFFLHGGLAAIKAGRILGVPSFFAYGECDFQSQVKDKYGIPRPEEIEGLKGIVSVSQKNTQELKSLGIVDDIPIITAPNSVDLSMFCLQSQSRCRKKFNLPEDKFIVGFVGGFIERKGDKRLLEAINKTDGAYGVFAGRGDTPPTGSKVLFCHALDHNQIPEFLNACDVFCLPTLSEGSCNAIVEAMACGLPVISSDLPFNDDILDDTCSIRIDPNNIEQIADAVRTLKNDVHLRKELSDGALKKSQQLEIGVRAKKILEFMADKIKKENGDINE